MLSDRKPVLSMRQPVDRNPAIPVNRIPFPPGRIKSIFKLHIFFQPIEWSSKVYNYLVEIRLYCIGLPVIEPQRINEDIIHKNYLVCHLQMYLAALKRYDPINVR